MSEEKRIDRLENISIDTRARVATLEAKTDRIEQSAEKIASDVSSLRSDFSNLRIGIFKFGERLAWKILIASAVGGTVAGLIAAHFGK